MVDNSSQEVWNLLYNQYMDTLRRWNDALQNFQKVSLELQKSYNTIITKAGKESSFDTMGLFGLNWEKALPQTGFDMFQNFAENWQNAMNLSTAKAYRDFGLNWQNTLNKNGFQQITAYGDLMNAFAETWNAMWPKQSKPTQSKPKQSKPKQSTPKQSTPKQSKPTQSKPTPTSENVASESQVNPKKTTE